MAAQLLDNPVMEVCETARVLIIGRSCIYVDGILQILDSSNAVGKVTRVEPGQPCMRYFIGEHPDILLIQQDAKKGPLDEYVAEMVSGYEGMRVLVFGESMSDELLFRVVSAGAHGYFNERMNGEHILQALQALRNGEYWVERRIMEKFISDRTVHDGMRNRVNLLGSRLTNRETEVLELVMEGLSTSEIADKIFLSHQGVKAHLTSLFRKFSVKNRPQLILTALNEISPVESLTRLVQQELQACRMTGRAALVNTTSV